MSLSCIRIYTSPHFDDTHQSHLIVRSRLRDNSCSFLLYFSRYQVQTHKTGNENGIKEMKVARGEGVDWN